MDAQGESPAPSRKSFSFSDFQQRYEQLFGESLPDVWYDETSAIPARRVVNETAALSLTTDGDTGEAVLSISELGCAAREFIVDTSDFYVRELPVGLTDEEKVDVESRHLRTSRASPDRDVN
ncbi:hypothetical protein ACXDF8_23015 [Mycolicibacterium sp. CBM1]